MQTIDESFSGKTLDLAVGQRVEVRLEENRTTGFRWKLTLPDSACVSLDEDTEQHGTVPGQGGVHTWRFKALQAGSGDIELAYRRSWGTADAAARTFTLHLRVTG